MRCFTWCLVLLTCLVLGCGKPPVGPSPHFVYTVLVSGHPGDVNGSVDAINFSLSGAPVLFAGLSNPTPLPTIPWSLSFSAAPGTTYRCDVLIEDFGSVKLYKGSDLVDEDTYVLPPNGQAGFARVEGVLP